MNLMYMILILKISYKIRLFFFFLTLLTIFGFTNFFLHDNGMVLQVQTERD